MDIKDFDAKIAELRQRLGRLGRNIGELTTQREFLIVKGRLNQKDGFSGATSSAAARLSASADELTTGASLLGDALSRASAARDRVSVIRGIILNESAFREAVDILEGKSIRMPLTEVPIMARDAFSDALEFAELTPQELSDLLASAFKTTQQALVELTSASKSAYDGLAQARSLLAGLNPSDPKSADIASVIETLTRSLDVDPIGVTQRLEADIFGPIRQAKEAFEVVRQKRDAALSELRLARMEFAELEAMDAKMTSSIALLAEKVSGVALPLVDVSQSRELPGWLDRLERNLDAGKFDAFAVGLSRWRELLTVCKGQREAVIHVAENAIQRREELRGRFSALDAKRRSVQISQQVSSIADALSSQAKGLLFGAVTPLQEAEKLVKEYESILARQAAA